MIAALRWWHLAAVLDLEPVLFGADAWTAETFWSELAQYETRYYLGSWDSPAQPAPVPTDTVLSGYAGLACYQREAWVQTLGVGPAYQRRGLGASLLECLVGESRRRGATSLALEVGAGNVAAQRLYARHGFALVGRRRGYYQATGEDALVMTVSLS